MATMGNIFSIKWYIPNRAKITIPKMCFVDILFRFYRVIPTSVKSHKFDLSNHIENSGQMNNAHFQAE